MCFVFGVFAYLGLLTLLLSSVLCPEGQGAVRQSWTTAACHVILADLLCK